MITAIRTVNRASAAKARHLLVLSRPLRQRRTSALNTERQDPRLRGGEIDDPRAQVWPVVLRIVDS